MKNATPMSTELALSREQPAPHQSKSSINGPVWIVDDDDVRFSISFALSPRYEPQTFGSGEEFLENVSLDRPGCLLLDMRMLGMSGLEVQKRLIEANSPIGIVFLSGHGDVRTAVSTMEAGAVSFLEKPVDPDLLSDAVRRALDISYQRHRRQHIRQLLGTLTNRERQVFHMVCQGLKNVDIAEALFVSKRTIEVHRMHISRKLGYAAPIRVLYELAGLDELFSSSDIMPKALVKSSSATTIATDAINLGA